MRGARHRAEGCAPVLVGFGADTYAYAGTEPVGEVAGRVPVVGVDW